MECPSCGHDNLSEFPFCEQCLAMLPAASAGDSAVFEHGAVAGARTEEDRWPSFPWNPEDLADPLIGRQGAVDDLAAVHDRVVSTSTGHLHLLLSSYGMGKGRVVRELGHRIRDENPDARIATVTCPGTGGTHRLWDLIVRALAEIAADADPKEAASALHGAVARWLPESADDVTRLIAYLAGYDVADGYTADTPRDVRAMVAKSTHALARWCASMTEGRALLLVIEDAHRATGPALASMGALMGQLEDRPMMLLLSGASGLSETLPGWDELPVTRLRPLGKRDTKKMASLYLYGLEDVPAELVSRMVTQSRGNPFALKSMIRYVWEAGGVVKARGGYKVDEAMIWDLDLPDSLEGVVLAQMDVLSEDERRILGHASVVGERFWLGALVALERCDTPVMEEPGAIIRDDAPARLRRTLNRLVSARHLEHRVSAIPGEEAYGFRAEVQWRVAVDTVPAATGQRLHRVVHQWLSLQSGRVHGSLLAELARHAQAAGDGVRAARYLLELGRDERRRFRPRSARRALEQALALVPIIDASLRLEIGQELGDVLTVLGEYDAALERYQRVLQQAWRLRLRDRGAHALVRIAKVQRSRGYYQEAVSHLTRSLHLFEAVGDYGGVASACNDLGQMYFLRGRFDEALRAFKKGEELHRRVHDREGLAESVHHIGLVHFELGDMALAEEVVSDALSLRRDIDDRHGILRSLGTLAGIALMREDVAGAAEAWREALALARALEDRRGVAVMANNLGEALWQLGDADEATTYLDTAIRVSDGIDLPRVSVDARRNRAHVHILREAWDDAGTDLDQARALAKKLDLPRLLAAVERSLGELAWSRWEAEGALKRPRQAEESLRRAARIFEKAGYGLEAALTHERLAALYTHLGEAPAATRAQNAADRLRVPAVKS